jgi:hypothetical protein
MFNNPSKEQERSLFFPVPGILIRISPGEIRITTIKIRSIGPPRAFVIADLVTNKLSTLIWFKRLACLPQAGLDLLPPPKQNCLNHDLCD